MDCSVKVMRRPAALLATIVSIVCAAAFVFPTLAFAEGGTVKVTGSDATYSSLTDAAAAVKANGTKGDITYTVSGTAAFDGGNGGAYNTLAPEGVTSVTIKGTNNAQVNLTGSYEVVLCMVKTIDYDGATGTISLDANHDAIKDGFIMTCQYGRLELAATIPADHQTQ